MRRKDLERLLGSLEIHPSPKSYFEQYTLTETVAARILTLAAYTYDDIVAKVVYDLGCGSGRLAIGAAVLGAEHVVGVDIDPVALATAKRNAEKVMVNHIIDWVAADIQALTGSCDTVLQNPPFGVQRRGADRAFLRKALGLGKVVYSLHKSETDAFIRRFVRGLGASITTTFTTQIDIPRMFEFHRKPKYPVEVHLYRIVA